MAALTRILVALVVVGAVCTGLASAQEADSREAVIAQAEASKSEGLAPSAPASIDRGWAMSAGDVLQAGVVYTGELSALSISGFAAVNVVFACGWLAVAFGLRRKIQAMARQTGKQEL